MNSVGEECNELKREYDNCFNAWFREKYLKGIYTDSCSGIFKKYQACVKNAMKEQGMDLTELEESMFKKEQLQSEASAKKTE